MHCYLKDSRLAVLLLYPLCRGCTTQPESIRTSFEFKKDAIANIGLSEEQHGSWQSMPSPKTICFYVVIHTAGRGALL